ncbi:MAG TPA: FG-GAP-like repeat-containing protein [Polyangia bacterium]|jgi:MYXO-CTERM domain-containing protein
MRRTAAVLGSLIVASAAWAGWPPPPTATPAELADPVNWPNDPDYGYGATSPGQWPLYCFVPLVATLVTSEAAAGMCVDRAWGRTVGSPDAVIAVIGSGIDWGDDDVIRQVRLNHRELVNHRPLHADGTACGGTGALAGFDCDGDGVLTVADYRDTPSLAPAASPGHPLGDANGNGRLDPEDLILNFADGVDDDGNGYTDDIAGWDLLKDDRDAADDLHDGGGTVAARVAAAGTNDMIGGAGVCPLCRVLPVRAAGPLGDAATVAKALAYAVDSGARVALIAVEIDELSAFLSAAMDYAEANGVVVVTPVGSAGSRGHAPPAITNAALTVGAVTADAVTLAATTTFLAEHPRSGFGGQLALVGAGPGGALEAAAAVAGIAGLLVSAPTPVTAAEVRALLTATADEVDGAGFDQRSGHGRANAGAAVELLLAGQVPAAVDITAPAWFTPIAATGPAIEIRGTVRAPRADAYDWAVEWAPGVQPLEADFRALPGGAAAVAPGVVAGASGPLTTITPADIDPAHPRDPDSPLGENDATFTVRVRAAAHYGATAVASEARRVFSRVVDPALAAGFPLRLGESGGRPKLADLDGDGVRELIYPAGGSLHVLKLTPAGPVEVDGFPFLTNRVDGLAAPAPTTETPVYLAAPAYQGGVDPALGREPITGAPAIADLDGDGAPEIVFATAAGTVYVIGRDGHVKAGWPWRLPRVPSCAPVGPIAAGCSDPGHRTMRGVRASPVLADMDHDGQLDVVVAALDGSINVWHHDGTPVSGWPVTVHYTGALAAEPPRGALLATPVVADFNGDGYPDLLVGSAEQLGQAAAVHLVDGRGQAAPQLELAGWPVTLPSLALPDPRSAGIAAAGAIARFDGVLAGVVHGQGAVPAILPGLPGAQATLGALPPGALPQPAGLADPTALGPLTAATAADMVPLLAAPVLGDLDQDGVPDVITAGASSLLAAQLAAPGGAAARGERLLGMWSGRTGAMLPASPVVISDDVFGGGAAVADLDGDGYPEAILGTAGHLVHAVDACGRAPAGFPKATGHSVTTSVAVGDLDGDHTLELVAGTADGWLWVWHTTGRDDGVVQWEAAHHDNRNSGNLEEPLGQGGAPLAPVPLTAAVCRPQTDGGVADAGGPDDAAGGRDAGGPDDAAGGPDAGHGASESGGGGCGCRSAPAGSGTALLGLVLALALSARRRRGRARSSTAA